MGKRRRINMAFFSNISTTQALTGTTTTIVVPISPSSTFIDKITVTYNGTTSNLTSVMVGVSPNTGGTSPIFFRIFPGGVIPAPLYNQNFISNPIYAGTGIQSLVVQVTATVATGSINVYFTQFELPLLHQVNNLTFSAIGTQNFTAGASPQSYNITTPNAAPVKIKSFYGMFAADSPNPDQYYLVGNATSGFVTQTEIGDLSQQSTQLTTQDAILNPSQPLQLFTRHTITNTFTINYVVTWSVLS